MELSKILTADVLDIIFDGKNKSYGAYELRKSYSKRLLLSVTMMLTVLLLLWAGYLFANNSEKAEITGDFQIADVVLDKVDMPKKIEVPPPPPPPAQAAAPKVKTIVFSTPVIADVPETEMPPTEEIDRSRIGLIKTDGAEDVGDVAPPAEGPARQGVIAAPTAHREAIDSIWITVQIESQYPGGTAAWSRFLNRNVSGNYPQDAIDQGIQGRVEVQFIVDRDGTVSDITVVSGPEELRALAIKTIKKSGKWIPAEQNGRKVKSYKRQPFLFQLPQE